MAWFHSFFDREYVEILSAKRPLAITRREARVLAQHLKLKPGMRVLDIPCGFGRHALEFAKRGCLVTGVDLSRAMLEVRKKHARLNFLRMDMRNVTFKAEFDAIFVSSSGYFSNAENQDLLKRLARALKPGGRLALWTFSTLVRARQPRGRRWMKIGKRYILETFAFDKRRGLYESNWIIWRPGMKQPLRKYVRVHGYSVPVWREMLKKAGLRMEKAGAKPDDDQDGGGLQLIAVKPRAKG